MEGSNLSENAATLAEVARALNAAHSLERQGKSARLPALFFFTDEKRLADPLPSIARLPKGCGIIFRHYNVAQRSKLARDVVTAAHKQGRICLIAADEQMARDVGADGLHLPEHMLEGPSKSWPDAPWPWPDSWVITAAAHDAAALAKAQQAGVDAAFLSPVFETPSHPGSPALGPKAFAELVQGAALPIYALGGITAQTVTQLDGSGAFGIGAIGALIG